MENLGVMKARRLQNGEIVHELELKSNELSMRGKQEELYHVSIGTSSCYPSV